MHTSSHTRTEARKLFFGNPEAQYCIDAGWLLEGGYPGVVLDDMGFLVHVTRLDVGFHWMTHKTWMRPQDYLEWEDTEEKAVEDMAGGMEGQIEVFWRMLQRRFPNARHVTLSEEHARKPDEWPPQIFRQVAQLCPLGMKVSVAVLHGDRSFECRLDRCVWQQIDSREGASARDRWEKISTPARSLILMPLKVFRGPVGAYQALWRKNMDVFEQKRAAEILLIAAIEQHHFQARHEPFRCFAPGCDVWFHRPNEFTLHVIQTGHSEHAIPPQPFEALFAANKERLGKKLQDARTVRRSIEEKWGEYGSEERRLAELAYLKQLECNPMYAQGNRQS